MPYTILIYPFVFVVFPRLWSVSRRHGYITAADFVGGRFGSRWLALAVAVTGIVATMPYIALQLVGIEVVIAAMGFARSGLHRRIAADHRLRDSRGLHLHQRPARARHHRDRQGHDDLHHGHRGDGRDPDAARRLRQHLRRGAAGEAAAGAARTQRFGAYSAYATLAFGSALALFLYPHAVTGVLSASSRHAIRRNTALLPAYSLVLALIALLGFMAIAAGRRKAPEFAALFKQYGANFAVPALFLHSFPSWFAGFAFAAIGIGALVPAAIMSIAAANLFTRNIYRAFIRPDCTPAQESQMAKWSRWW